MNYWLPDPANLAVCMEPVLDLLDDLAISGRAMASIHYGARGWVLHHNTDLWRATGRSMGRNGGCGQRAAPLICAQLWSHAAHEGFTEALVRRPLPGAQGRGRILSSSIRWSRYRAPTCW